MPAFVAFTLGPETNPRLLADTETAPLLVGRFRAVAPRPSTVSLSSSLSSLSSLVSVDAAATAVVGSPPLPPPPPPPGGREGSARAPQLRPAAPAPAPLPHRPQSPPPVVGCGRDGGLAWSGYGTLEEATTVEVTTGTLVTAGAAADDEDEDEDEVDDDDDEDPDDDNEQTDPLLDAPRPTARRRRRAVRGLQRAARRARRHLRDLWLTPTRAAVRRAVARWWTRWALLVVLPAAVAVAWCAVPLPQCVETTSSAGGDVRVRFWAFLLAYYGPYNVTALLWITKVFNLYSLNWWPPGLGFPLSVSLLAALALAVPAAAVLAARAVVAAAAGSGGGYLHPAPALVLAARGLLALARHNTAWVAWTFAVMAMPGAAALAQLLRHERHLPRHPGRGLTAAAALWLGDADAAPLPRRRRRWWDRPARWWRAWWRPGTADDHPERPDRQDRQDHPDHPLALAPPAYDDVVVYSYEAATTADDDDEDDPLDGRRQRQRQWWRPTLLRRRRHARPPLPASFVRFLWLMAALFTALLAYGLGEAAASLFVAALPAMRHATAWAVAYVYGWTVVVFLLDALTGWILGGHQGERVGSYPLGWVFKLFFMLTYQTYVRALYVRLRSPSQFVYLQVLSSTSLVVLSPLLMSPAVHRLLAALRLNGQPYAAFQKVCVRNVFVRIVAENASMLAFLGSLLVLRFGPNRALYPYLADDADPDYTFAFTLYASAITWACELAAAAVVAALIRYFYRLRVVAEGQHDLAAWPELLPTSVAVAVHVLQNMLFSIIRLRFC